MKIVRTKGDDALIRSMIIIHDLYSYKSYSVKKCLAIIMLNKMSI